MKYTAVPEHSNSAASPLYSLKYAAAASSLRARLASIDGFGQGTVSFMGDAGSATSSYHVGLARIGESGWAGVAFHPHTDSIVATAHNFSREINVFDQDRYVVSE